MLTTHNENRAVASKQHTPKNTYHRARSISSIGQVEHALTYIDATDRDTWIKCGMAIKSEHGDSGFDVWDRWSARADNYRARDAASCWKSFNDGGGVSIGSLFHFAKQGGYIHNTTDNPVPPTQEEIAQREATRNAEADALARRREAAATIAAKIWNEPPSVLEVTQPSVSEHPYAVRKGIDPVGAKVFRGEMSIGGMDCNGALMLPMSLNGKITSLQFINAEGNKRFLPNGEKGGFLIGKIEDGKPACVCEGLATGVTIHEATGYPVAVAFDAGNTKKIASALRAKKSELKIVMCADDDESGTGQRKAAEAAQLVGGFVAMPVFGETRLAGDTDFNDMSRQGHDAVKLAIDSALNASSSPSSGNVIVGASNLGNKTEPPEPLPALPEVMPFDYAYLPTGLRGFVKDISERMQCPPDFAAVAVFVMMATLIGRKVGMRPMRNNDWTVICNLWGAVVGNSGVMKSPTLSAALSPLNKISEALFESFNNAKAEFEGQAEVSKLKESVNKKKARKSLEKDLTSNVISLLHPTEQNDKPILERLITNNASYEALGEILIENPNGLLVLADEIIGLLKQLDAGGQEVARAFYLTAADGDKPYTFDRIVRGKGLHIAAVILSVLGGIQPGVLAEYVRQATSGGAGADGLLQRFSLLVYPDISPDWTEVDRYPDGDIRRAVNELAEWMHKVTPHEIGADGDQFGGVPFLRFDDAAQLLFSEWRAALEHRLRSGEEHPAIVSHLSKYRKLIPSLALINHLCDSQKGAVSETSLMRAIAFSEYLESHARRIYSYATRPDIDAAKTLLKRLSAGKLSSPFSTRDIYQKGWAGLENPSKTLSAINLLLEYRHLTEEAVVTGGRPTTLYHWVKGEEI